MEGRVSESTLSSKPPHSRKCPVCGLDVSITQTSCPVDGTPTVEDFSKGTLLDGKYEFLELIGSGGMGVIYKARQVVLNKIVAIKMLHSDLVTDKSVKRFQREGKAMSTLSHPSIITVHDFAISHQGQPYMVMDYVVGQNLEAKLLNEGALDIDFTVNIMLQVCDALEHAHNNGVLHLDLKPSNILLINNDMINPRIRILDFGIAKVIQGDSNATLAYSHVDNNAGSPLYMSPEQCYGTALDRRSDLFSLGATMYECLTGYPPFVGTTLAAVIQKVCREPAPSMKDASLGKEFPPGIETIINRLLEKKPEDRYQSATELSLDLEDFRDGVEIKPAETVAPPQQRPTHKSLVLVIAAVLILIVLAAWLIHSITKSVPQIVQTPVSNVVGHEPGANDIPYPKENDVKKSVAKWVQDHPDVTQLPFMSWGITDAYMAPLATQSSYLNIDLHDNPIRGDGLKYLEQCQPTVIRLDSTDITDGALIHLSKMVRLQAINLRNTRINGSGIHYLKDLALTRLDLSATHMTDSNLKYLREPRITCLNLDGTKVTSAGMEEIAHMTGLRELDLSHTKIDNAGIAKLSTLPHLLTLRLTGDNIDDGCVKSLERFKSLVDLDVAGTGITGEGLTYLGNHHQFVEIFCFGCRGDMITALKTFQTKQPNCALIHYKPRSGDPWRTHK